MHAYASKLQAKMFHKDANSWVASEMRNIEYRSRKEKRSVVAHFSFCLWIPPLSPRIGVCAKYFKIRSDISAIAQSFFTTRPNSQQKAILRLHLANDCSNIKITHELVANYSHCMYSPFIKSFSLFYLFN